MSRCSRSASRSSTLVGLLLIVTAIAGAESRSLHQVEDEVHHRHYHHQHEPDAAAAVNSKTQEAFEGIYQSNFWGTNGRGSGTGSDLSATTWTVRSLLTILELKNIKSMVDAPCGAMEWMPQALRIWGQQHAGFRYTGLDVVRSVVASNQERFSNESQWDFAVHDFTVKVPPQADLIFCRDALQHLPIMAVIDALENFALSGASWLLVGSYMTGAPNTDIVAGDYRPIDLQTTPFDIYPEIVLDENLLATPLKHKEPEKHQLLYSGHELRTVNFSAMRLRAMELAKANSQPETLQPEPAASQMHLAENQPASV